MRDDSPRTTDEQSDNNDAATETTMSDNNDYDDEMFWSNDADTITADGNETLATTKWKLGTHRAQTALDVSKVRDAAKQNEGVDDELADLLNRAADRVSSASINDFECPVCGLTHGHSDTKHDIRDRGELAVTDDFADRMNFAPNCHCGVNELAMLIDFYGEIAVPVFTDGERFKPFTEMMPSEEADHAIALYNEAKNNPDITRTTRKCLSEAKLQPSDAMVDSLDALMDRFNDIRNAASNAKISDMTEERIEQIRANLIEQFAQQ